MPYRALLIYSFILIVCVCVCVCVTCINSTIYSEVNKSSVFKKTLSLTIKRDVLVGWLGRMLVTERTKAPNFSVIHYDM